MVSHGRTGLPATQKTIPSSVELFIVSVLLIVSYEFSPLSRSVSIYRQRYIRISVSLPLVLSLRRILPLAFTPVNVDANIPRLQKFSQIQYSLCILHNSWKFSRRLVCLKSTPFRLVLFSTCFLTRMTYSSHFRMRLSMCLRMLRNLSRFRRLFVDVDY